MRLGKAYLLWTLAGGIAAAAALQDGALEAAFAKDSYRMEESGGGGWQGVNRAQRLQLEFSGPEVRLTHSAGTVGIHFTGFGYGDRLHASGQTAPVAGEDRVEYRREGVTEWYWNGPRGLEQGFTLAQRPGEPHGAGSLTVAFRVSGALEPRLEGNSVSLGSRAGAVLRYSGLKAVDAHGREMASHMEVRGREIRLMVDDTDAAYPLIIDPTWTQQQQLTASDGANGDLFGVSVAIDGDTAVIGAEWKNSGRGAAYVYVRNAGVWTQQQKLTASDAAANDWFGTSVSISGDTVLVGTYRGAAYFFARSGQTWTQTGKCIGASGGGFGLAVAINGDTAVIGSPTESPGGAAYVYIRFNQTKWGMQQKLTPSDGVLWDNFGSSVAVNASRAVVGAPGKNQNQGAAYTFTRSGYVWSQQQELAASDGTAGAAFACSLSVYGNTAIFGTKLSPGAAYVFVNSGGTFTQRQKLTASDGSPNDGFGISVSVSGYTAVIGAWGANAGLGAAYIFSLTRGIWTEQQKLTPPDGQGGEFGIAAVSHDTVVVTSAADGKGTAWVFVRPTLGTSQLVVGSGTGTGSVLLSCSGPWTATANDAFLHVSSDSTAGNGNQPIAFTYDAFPSTGSRTGTLTIAGLTLTVIQAGTNYVAPGPASRILAYGQGITGLALDFAGNIYIADGAANSVMQWDIAAGNMEILASSGLSNPTGVAVDGYGDIYVADYGNQVVKVVNPSSYQVNTLVSGVYTPYAVVVDNSGNVIFTNPPISQVDQWNAFSSQTTVLTGTNDVTGLDVDSSGNLYFSGTYAGSVTVWNPTYANSFILSGLNNPLGVAVDGSGNVYIADTNSAALKVWNPVTREVTTLLTAQGNNRPYAVRVDGAGNIFFAYQSAVNVISSAFVGPASLTVPPTAGSDMLLPVIPSNTSLAGIYAPTSDQDWLTVGPISNGVVHFSFTANNGVGRTANLTILGRQIAVTQSSGIGQTISFGALTNLTLDAVSMAVSATASSGLPVIFTSTTPAVCGVSGSTVTLIASGTCTIQAAQPGDSHWGTAAPVSQSFQVMPPSRCDIKRDGRLNAADVLKMVSEALGVITAGDDLNGDHTVNVVDIQIVTDAALGATCVAN